MAIIASAPGKVLITGGYLVLERPNAGLVLSTNARFYAIVKPVHEDVSPDSWAWSWVDVKVTSPQLSRETKYKLSIKECVLHCASSGESRNAFVEQAVQYSVAAALVQVDAHKKPSLEKLLLHGLDITILGCNEFYSYRKQIEAEGLALTPGTLASLPPFSAIAFNDGGSSPEEGSKPEVAKTGLGSSAAMTTSVVAAVLHYLGTEEHPHRSRLDLIHVIAQCSHCIAQGKIGSGFDVSSAVYGSQRYVRFSPQLLSPSQDGEERKGGLQLQVTDILRGNWDHQRTKFSLPPLMTLMLGEPGAGGSSTPSMVGAVRRWQKSDPLKAAELRRDLANANSQLETHLALLTETARKHPHTYSSTISKCSLLTPDKWPAEGEAEGEVGRVIVRELVGARDAMLVIRCHMRAIGEAAGVPIEPEPQTRLLDRTMAVEGVLLAGIPGAGGFDAVFTVALGESSADVAATWTELGVLPLLVREDPSGVRLEPSDPRSDPLPSSFSSLSISSHLQF